MARLNGVRTYNNRYYDIDVKANPYTVVVTTRYEDSSHNRSAAILSHEQAFELAKGLLEGASLTREQAIELARDLLEKALTTRAP